MKASETFLLAIAAPMGMYPLVSALATVKMSGLTPQCSVANILPVRPKPVMTSSQIMMTPYLSHISRMVGQYSGCGTWMPAAAEIGSPMKAATVDGPSCCMAISKSLAHWRLHPPSALQQRPR